MNSKLIAACGGSAVLGVLYGWAITADYWEQKLLGAVEASTQIIGRQERHISRIQKELDDATGEIWENIIEQTANSDMQIVVPQDDVETDEDVIPPGETEDETRNRLGNLIAEYTSDPDVVSEFIEVAGGRDADRVTAPFVISKQKYAWDEDEGDSYSKITLMYFPKLQLLLDEDESVVNNPNELIGTDYVRRFGDESGDADVVFVRNRRLNTDFEVVRDTENDPPIHVRYGMGREEFAVERAAGNIVLEEDRT